MHSIVRNFIGLSLVGAIALFFLVHDAHAADLTIGGFNQARGGATSLADPNTANLKKAIMRQFPGARFDFFSQLTATQLSKVNVVFLSVTTGDFSAISPLSKAEQTALRNFVVGGGTAVIFTDNDTFSAKPRAPASNASLLEPFGLAATGTLKGAQPIELIACQNPIAKGPAGQITQLDTFYPGWFSILGASVDLGTLVSDGKPGLAWLHPGALGIHSGAVVFFADSSLVFDSHRTANDTIGILNALALAPH